MCSASAREAGGDIGYETLAGQRIFERAVAEFKARPQLRCNLEQLAAAALLMHDQGLAELEQRNGRTLGSFGGRMVPQAGERMEFAAQAWLASVADRLVPASDSADQGDPAS